jgi:hypothetical protein
VELFWPFELVAFVVFVVFVLVMLVSGMIPIRWGEFSLMFIGVTERRFGSSGLLVSSDFMTFAVFVALVGLNVFVGVISDNAKRTVGSAGRVMRLGFSPRKKFGPFAPCTGPKILLKLGFSVSTWKSGISGFTINVGSLMIWDMGSIIMLDVGSEFAFMLSKDPLEFAIRSPGTPGTELE